MKCIIKYKLNENGTIPSYIEDGGYYPNSEFLVGKTKDIEITENTKLTRETLKQLIEQLGVRDINGKTIDAEKEANRYFDEKEM